MHRKYKLEHALERVNVDQAVYKSRKQNAAKHLKQRQAQQPETKGPKPTNNTQSINTASTQTIRTKKQPRAVPKPDHKFFASIRTYAKVTPNITYPQSKIMNRQEGVYLQEIYFSYIILKHSFDIVIPNH